VISSNFSSTTGVISRYVHSGNVHGKASTFTVTLSYFLESVIGVVFRVSRAIESSKSVHVNSSTSHVKLCSRLSPLNSKGEGEVKMSPPSQPKLISEESKTVSLVSVLAVSVAESSAFSCVSCIFPLFRGSTEESVGVSSSFCSFVKELSEGLRIFSSPSLKIPSASPSPLL
jgi:hypothetical protein